MAQAAITRTAGAWRFQITGRPQRRFKRKVLQEDIIKEVKRHAFYLKPGQKKRLKSALARKRNRQKRNRDSTAEQTRQYAWSQPNSGSVPRRYLHGTGKAARLANRLQIATVRTPRRGSGQRLPQRPDSLPPGKPCFSLAVEAGLISIE